MLPWFEVVPDWLCELRSPATGRLDRRLKLGIYRARGVGHVWLVNPLTRCVEVLRATPEDWLPVDQGAGEEVARLEPFAALPIELADLWL